MGELIKKEDKLPARPEMDKLSPELKDFIQKYTEFKTIKEACKKTGLSRYDIEVFLSQDPNFAVCMEYADKDINDELEHLIMCKAGVFGKFKSKEVELANPQTLIQLLKVKNPKYRSMPRSATQINADKVSINYERG